jgi:hypothetical protein
VSDDEEPTLWDVVENMHDELMEPDPVKQAMIARRAETIAARFTEFHQANPLVYELLVRFSRELLDRGYHHCGISLIWERMRWEMVLRTADPDGFKLNNDWRSRYARLIMEREPDLDGFFRIRELRAV